MRPDVWIPERSPEVERDRLATIATVHLFPPAGEIPAVAGAGDILIAADDATRAIDHAAHIDGLRVIQTFSAGIDRIVGRVPPGVILCDAAGVHDVAVAEWVVMVILASQRRLAEHIDGQRTAHWREESLVGSDLDDATVVLLGAGSIGKAVEARLAPFGAQVVRIARRPRPGVQTMADLPAILPTADIVVSLLPLTPETRGTVDAPFLAQMPDGALLVNASRGPIVDTEALTAEVRTGRLRAALDVTDPEPLPDGHPLWTAPGVILTPHVASDVHAEGARAWQLAFEQVGRYARGEPLINIVTEGY
jgi:phosphoglycerate dehydrogenase-like enzyme